MRLPSAAKAAYVCFASAGLKPGPPQTFTGLQLGQFDIPLEALQIGVLCAEVVV